MNLCDKPNSREQKGRISTVRNLDQYLKESEVIKYLPGSNNPTPEIMEVAFETHSQKALDM